MAFEIERKFLIHTAKIQLEHLQKSHIQQGYLNQDPERIVRVRTRDGIGFLTIKGKNVGATRLEMEYQIPIEDAQALLLICLPHIIEKERYLYTFGNHTWEIDRFFGKNQGLWLAEIELSSEEETFEQPDWISTEVTMDHRYTNSYLSEHPFSLWMTS